MNPPSISVWLAEGQSSQRDMLASLQQLKAAHADSEFNIIASHRSNRPEIFEFADLSFIEPKLEVPTLSNHLGRPIKEVIKVTIDTDSTSRISTPEMHNTQDNPGMSPRCQFVLDNTVNHNTKVLLTGRNSIDYEAHRAAFLESGIRLLTGATSTAMLQKIDDKFAFMQHCLEHNIPVATGWRFDTVTELKQLLKAHGHQRLCVKPVSGIFAQGFWILDTQKSYDEQYDSFEHLYFTDSRKIHIEQFINAYANSSMVQTRPIPMLLMPYIAGQEYSIDVVCERGEMLAAITRHKIGKVQHIGYDESVVKVVKALIQCFECDGIVSVQTKQDAAGIHRVLEINSRPSGGIGYTKHSGVDLTQIGFGYWLGLSDKPKLSDTIKAIQPCRIRSIMTSVKI